MKRILVLSLVLVLVLGLTIAYAEVKNPGTYINVQIGEPDTMDPHYAYDTASEECITFLYDNLIAYKGQSLTEFIPMIAAEVPTVENGLFKDDGKTYTFPIRTGVKFHNGNALTPEDVEYSIKRGILFDPASGPIWMLVEPLFGYGTLEDFIQAKLGVAWNDMVNEDRSLKKEEYGQKLIDLYYQYIDPVVKVEGDKVVFHLARPYPPFLSILASNSSWSAILCKKTGIELGCWDGKAEGWWKFHNIKKEESPLYEKENGSGPFILSSWDRAEQKVTLVRNEQYWGTKPKLEKVIIWGVDEWSTRRAMLEAGDADQIYIPQQYIDQLSGLSGIDVKKSPRLFVDTFQFNWNITKGSKFLGSGQMDGNGIPPEFFSDVHLRKAFASCIDYETFTNQIMKGFGIQIPTVVPVGILGYSENLPKYQFNLDTAKEEFQKAFDGKLWENGFKLTIIYNTGNERRQTAAEMLKENIESLNPKFKIDVQSQQWPTILDLYKQGQLPMFGIGWQADFADPHNFIFTYYHSNGAYGSTYGDLYVKFAQENENLDKKIDQAIAETDPTKRQALYEDIQKFVVDNAIGLPLAQVIEPEPMRTWVKDWQFHPIRPGTANYNEIYKQE